MTIVRDYEGFKGLDESIYSFFVGFPVHQFEMGARVDRQRSLPGKPHYYHSLYYVRVRLELPFTTCTAWKVGKRNK